MTCIEDKKILRERILCCCRSLPPSKVKAAGEVIFQQLKDLPTLAQAETVFCYVSRPPEVDTLQIMRLMLDRGQKLCVPRVRGKGEMQAHVLHRLEELKPGFRGILEPPAQAPVAEEPSLCLLPCVAATLDGCRLGYGGGYYDRYLAAHPAMRTLLICASWQIVDQLPQDAFDCRVDAVLTEQGLTVVALQRWADVLGQCG